jgi:hypothetical protein
MPLIVSGILLVSRDIVVVEYVVRGTGIVVLSNLVCEMCPYGIVETNLDWRETEKVSRYIKIHILQK